MRTFWLCLLLATELDQRQTRDVSRRNHDRRMGSPGHTDQVDLVSKQLRLRPWIAKTTRSQEVVVSAGERPCLDAKSSQEAARPGRRVVWADLRTSHDWWQRFGHGQDVRRQLSSRLARRG